MEAAVTADQEARGSLLVVNLRGLVNTRMHVRKTLEQLHLARRFNSTIVPDTPNYRGMLNSAKEHLAWHRADSSTVERLLRSRSERSNGNKFSEADLEKYTQFSSFSELAKAIESGREGLEGIQGMRSFFRLSPPKGGFRRSTRRQYGQGGILGPNQELSTLIEKMIV